MRLRRLLHRVGRGDPQCDESSLSLFPQLVEKIGAMVVIAHHRAVERYPALCVASPAAHGCEGASVANGSDREFVLNGAVGETINPVWEDRADLCGDVVPPADDDVDAKVTNQLLVGCRGVCDDAKSVCFSKLHDVAAIASCRAGDGKRLAWIEGKLVKREPCRESVHRQSGRLDVG